MLRSLKIKFVVIIMALVGTVLISVLGGSFISTWQTQRDMINEALERGLQGDFRVRPFIADSGTQPGDPGVFALVVDTDNTGTVRVLNYPIEYLNLDLLSEYLDIAQASTNDSGADETLHIAWRKTQLDDNEWRMAIAETSTIYYSLRTLAIKDLVIITIAMGALLAISVSLSSWVLRPVQQAWNQQRRFVADASHELKTPLAVIIANMEILSKDGAVPEESKRWIQSTADESAHMKNLVEELLELARTDESASGTQGVMQKLDVDFSDMVESATLEFDAIAFERGCLIEEDIATGIHVNGDPEWLGRLVKILIENACKYSEQGSTIHVTLAREGRRCTYSVNNRGQVIAAEDLPHVFDRFYRTDKARSRDAQTGGFGLGLAIAKGIATSSGGDITATSSEENGTTFRVVLPCA